MNKKSLIFISLLAFSATGFAQVSSLHESFDKKPSNFIYKDLDNMAISTPDFASAVLPEAGWYLSDKKGVLNDEKLNGRMAILSCSRRTDVTKQTNNYLITPQIAVKNGTRLSWEAKSIHYTLRESYKVMISTAGTEPSDFTELATIVDENYLWTRRSLDLSEYAGKNVYIAFVHSSIHKFLLALDEIDVKLPTAPDYTAVNSGLHFFSKDEEALLKFNVTNHGAPKAIKRYEVRTGDTKLGATETNETGEIEIPVELALNTPLPYSLYVVHEDGSETKILDDFANRSWFRRKMFVEKFTGTWCNVCPRVTFPFHYGILKYNPEEVIGIEAHTMGAGGDSDDSKTYLNPTVYAVHGDYPALWFNRAYKADNPTSEEMTAITLAGYMPTYAEITIDSFEADLIGNITATATLTFAEDIDNSDRHIRPNLMLVERECQPNRMSANQAWSAPAQNIAHAEFYYLPGRVAKDVSIFHNVVRSSTANITGVADSALPDQIKAGEKYVVTGYLKAPAATVQDRADLRIIGTIIDNSVRTCEVMNAGSLDVDLSPFEITKSKIELTETELTMDRRETHQLTYTMDPENPDVTFTWKSDNPTVAGVGSTGIINTSTYGEANITLTSSQGLSAVCHVTVKEPNSVTEVGTIDFKAVRTGTSVNLTLPEDVCAVTVYDTTGKLLSSSQARGSLIIDVPSHSLLIIKVETPFATKTIKI